MRYVREFGNAGGKEYGGKWREAIRCVTFAASQRHGAGSGAVVAAPLMTNNNITGPGQLATHTHLYRRVSSVTACRPRQSGRQSDGGPGGEVELEHLPEPLTPQKRDKGEKKGGECTG